MKALLLSAPGKIEIKTIHKPIPGPGQALVRIKAASLNHRDEWCRQGKYPNIVYGTVLGSDGAGVVEAVGEAINSGLLGKEVIINPNSQWGKDTKVQSKDYKILGMPENGTFAEYLVVNADRLQEKPKHLDFVAASALPLGGLTAFRAVFGYGQVAKGKNVLITGVGGGVAQFAFLFSKSTGANVCVSSSKEEQLHHAIKLGATKGYNYTKKDWHKLALKEEGKFDVIIDSAGGDQLNTLIRLVKPGGKIVFYGATTGLPSSLNLSSLFWNQITLQGTTMGNDEEFEAMVQYVAEHKIEPIIDSARPFEQIVAAFDSMKAGKQLGKLVVLL